MYDNEDEITLAATVEINHENSDSEVSAVEVSTSNVEDFVAEEIVISEPTMEIEARSELPPSVETQSIDSDDTEEEEEIEEEEEEDDDYYRYKRRRYYDYDDFVCKKCKTDDSYDYVKIRPEILTDVPSLTQIASVCVAATLWTHVNIPKRLSTVSEKCAKTSVEWKSLRKEVLSLPRRLPIPKLIAKRIKGHVREMAIKITDWVSYHFRTVYLKNGVDKVVYNHVYHLVWRSNGSIDCEETARNLITSIRLSEVEKFKFLATYCLRDEIEKLSPSLFLNNAVEYVNAANYPLIDYWYRYFRNHQHKNADTTNACTMFQMPGVDNWPAKEYFFNCLSEDEQVREAIWLISAPQSGAHHQTAVLSKLDETQRSRVFIAQGVNIIINYIEPAIIPKFVLSTWLEIRHFITAEKCILIFRRMLKANIEEMLLTEIWLNTPDELKNFLIFHGNYEIIEKILLHWKWGVDSNFINVILRELPVDTRRSVIQEDFFQIFFEKLLRSGRRKQLGRILEFCFPEVEEIAQFKRNLIINSKHVKDTCLKLYSSGNMVQLNNILKQFFGPCDDYITHYKINLLNSSDGIRKCIDLLDSPTDVLNLIITDTLKDADQAIAFKKSLILSMDAIAKLKRLLTNNGLNVVVSCYYRLLKSAEDKLTFKKLLVGDILKQIRIILQNGDEAYLQSVMLWYLASEDAVQRCKKNMPLDLIFIDLLKESIFIQYDRLLTNCQFRFSFDPRIVDKFLNWYFQSPVAKMQYKMKIIRSYSNFEMFNTLLRKHDEKYLKALVQWFFQKDPVEIAKYKSEFPRNKIANLI